MSTPSKRLRTSTYGDTAPSSITPDDLANLHALTQGVEQENKEEKKRGGGFELPHFPLQLLPSVALKSTPSNWFCTNNVLSKKTCVQRSEKEIKDWTYPGFNNGIGSGMTEDECRRTCIFAPGPNSSSSSSSSSSSGSSGLGSPNYSAASSSVVPLLRYPIRAPTVGRNPGFINNLVTSMLTTRDASRILEMSRVNLVDYLPNVRNLLNLEPLLMALQSPSSNQYYLNQVLEILRLQESTSSKLLSYPLLVRYLPAIYFRNEHVFWTLFSNLPHAEKLNVIEAIVTSMDVLDSKTNAFFKRLLDTSPNVFEFNEREIIVDNALHRQMWNTRDQIFSNYYFYFYNLDTEDLEKEDEKKRVVADVDYFETVIEWFLNRRHVEELQTRTGKVITPDLLNWYALVTYTRETVDDEFKLKIWHIFLERGYYPPIEGMAPIPEDIPYYLFTTLATVEPIIAAIQFLKDPQLTETVFKDYISSSGVERLKRWANEFATKASDFAAAEPDATENLFADVVTKLSNPIIRANNILRLEENDFEDDER